jgi:hypothetical protein
MLKKCFHNHYFYQTNPKPQLKPKINLRRQPKKRLRTQSSYYNNQYKIPKQKARKPRTSYSILQVQLSPSFQTDVLEKKRRWEKIAGGG